MISGTDFACLQCRHLMLMGDSLSVTAFRIVVLQVSAYARDLYFVPACMKQICAIMGSGLVVSVWLCPWMLAGRMR